MSDRAASTVLRDAKRIVVKVGSSLVTNDGRGLDEAAIGEWCRQLAALALDGREVRRIGSATLPTFPLSTRSTEIGIEEDSSRAL